MDETYSEKNLGGFLVVEREGWKSYLDSIAMKIPKS